MQSDSTDILHSFFVCTCHECGHQIKTQYTLSTCGRCSAVIEIQWDALHRVEPTVLDGEIVYVEVAK